MYKCTLVTRAHTIHVCSMSTLDTWNLQALVDLIYIQYYFFKKIKLFPNGCCGLINLFIFTDKIVGHVDNGCGWIIWFVLKPLYIVITEMKKKVHDQPVNSIICTARLTYRAKWACAQGPTLLEGPALSGTYTRYLPISGFVKNE